MATFAVSKQAPADWLSTRRRTRLASALLAIAVLVPAVAGPPVPVRVAPLASVSFRAEVSAPATVVSLGDSRIAAELNAPIEAIPVQVGEIVEPDGTLVRLDCGDYELEQTELRARLAGTEARMAFARRQLDRARRLERQRTLSPELLEQRESELASLVAERDANRVRLAMADRRLDKCTIRAPFKAAVLERLASVGEYAMPGAPLIRVLDLSHLEVSADLIAGDAAALDGASGIVFRNAGHDYPVTLRALVPVVDPLTRTREARLLFIDRTALPGATGRLVWRTGTALPADLLVRRQGRLGVILAEDGRARFHPVPQAQEGRPARVELPPETLIVTDGRFALEDGDPIEIVE